MVVRSVSHSDASPYRARSYSTERPWFYYQRAHHRDLLADAGTTAYRLPEDSGSRNRLRLRTNGIHIVSTASEWSPC
jgi:hypothetical protein